MFKVEDKKIKYISNLSSHLHPWMYRVGHISGFSCMPLEYRGSYRRMNKVGNRSFSMPGIGKGRFASFGDICGEAVSWQNLWNKMRRVYTAEKSCSSSLIHVIINKMQSDCISHFPIDFEQNRILFGAKSIGTA